MSQGRPDKKKSAKKSSYVGGTGTREPRFARARGKTLSKGEGDQKAANRKKGERVWGGGVGEKRRGPRVHGLNQT